MDVQTEQHQSTSGSPTYTVKKLESFQNEIITLLAVILFTKVVLQEAVVVLTEKLQEMNERCHNDKFRLVHDSFLSNNADGCGVSGLCGNNSFATTVTT